MITTSLVPRPYYVGGRAGTTGRESLGDHAGTKFVLSTTSSGTTGTTTDMPMGPTPSNVLGDQGRSIKGMHKTASAAVLGEITPPSGARCGQVAGESLRLPARTTKALIHNDYAQE